MRYLFRGDGMLDPMSVLMFGAYHALSRAPRLTQRA